MKHFVRIFSLLAALATAALHAGIPYTRCAFTNAMASGSGSIDLGYIADFGFPSQQTETPAFTNLVASISNDVASVTNDMAFYLSSSTNRLCLTEIAGHCGTNAFFAIWGAVIDTLATNADAIAEDDLSNLVFATNNQMYRYVFENYDIPQVSNLLAKTRIVCADRGYRTETYDKTISGFMKWYVLISRADENGDDTFVVPQEILERYHSDFQEAFEIPDQE